MKKGSESELETEREFIGPIWTKTLASRIYSSAKLQAKVRTHFGAGSKSEFETDLKSVSGIMYTDVDAD